MCENSENIKATPPVGITNSLEQSDTYELFKRLVKEANSGNPQLSAIKGFTVGDLLGQGAFGEVYLARHQSTGEQVAIKVMHNKFAGQDKLEKRFKREIKNITFLDHPNIVKVRYSDLLEENLFYIMEYCNGGSIADILKKSSGRLPLERALEITFQALDGLHYLHNVEIPEVELSNGTTKTSKGLVHRDIKPGNLLLSIVNGVERVKIADYGLAKAFDLAGKSGITPSKKSGEKSGIGTYEFMPREQVRQSKYAKVEVDVWAMAASLYKMLTGKTPREFPEDQNKRKVILTTQPTPIRFSNKSIPEELAQVIDCALKDESDLYFKTAAQFKEALTVAANKIGLLNS